jgi:hypothetical protein
MLCGVHAVHWCAPWHRILCCDVCMWQLKIEMASQAPPKEAGSGKGGKGILSLRKRLRRRKGQRIRQRRRRRLRHLEARLSCEHICLGGNALK